MSELDVVIQDWHDEVEAEMVLLITSGTPPEAARIVATTIVANKRGKEHIERRGL